MSQDLSDYDSPIAKMMADNTVKDLRDHLEGGGRLRWQNWRPVHKWLFVKADPRVKKTRGGIELPDQQVAVERVMEGTGRILKVGNREEIFQAVNDHLEPGMRICFRGFLKDAFQEFEKDEDGLAIFMLRAEDVLMIIDDSVTMGAFS